MTRQARKRVVVLGGGFAGLYASTYLAAAEIPEGSVEITLVSEHNYFTFLPLLPEVVAGVLGREDVVFPYRVFAARYGYRFIRARIQGVDLARQRVETDGGQISYDYLVLAMGGRPRYPGSPSLAQHSLPLARVEDAMAIRQRIIQLAEQAAGAECEPERERLLSFAIAGAGPAGVEVAGEIQQLLTRVLPRYYGVETRPRIFIFQGGSRILTGWDPVLAHQGLEMLRKRGIQVYLDTRVRSYDGRTLVTCCGIQESRWEVSALIWTVGMAPATEGLAEAGLMLGERGHIRIREDLSVEGHENVFAVGDIASLVSERTGRPYSPVAPIAISQGVRAAANIENAIMGRPLEPYRAYHAGKIVSLGGGVALVDLFGWRITGSFAWIIYRTTYLLKLVGAKNKVRAVVSLLLNRIFEPDISCDSR